MSKKAMSRCLRAALAIGTVILCAVFFFLLPEYGRVKATVDAPEFAHVFWPCLIWAWAFALPIFAALIPAWRLCSSIGKPDGAFTRANVRNLRIIAVLAFIVAVIFPLGMVIIGFLGAGSPGLTVIVTPTVIFACAAVGLVFLVLGRLLDEAVRLREENDLTI